MLQLPEVTHEPNLAVERALLVRLMGDSHAAEDLAQETQLVGWRNAHKLHGQHARGAQLAGMARKLCLHLHRQQRAEVRWHIPAAFSPFNDLDAASGPVAAVDVEGELKLSRLLDRALTRLPQATRSTPEAHYIQRTLHAEIATQLGHAVDAVEARLRRGKGLLRRLLTTEFQNEAGAYDFTDSASASWQGTRIWCLKCGQLRLQIHFPREHAAISITCRSCKPDKNISRAEYRLTNAGFVRLLADLRRPRAILSRVATWATNYYRPALATRTLACTNCGCPARLQVFQTQDASHSRKAGPTLYVQCTACGDQTSSPFNGLVHSLPEVQFLWQVLTRIRTLSVREAEVDGQAAYVSIFECIAVTVRLTIVSARTTLQVLKVHPAPEAGGL